MREHGIGKMRADEGDSEVIRKTAFSTEQTLRWIRWETKIFQMGKNN